MVFQGYDMVFLGYGRMTGMLFIATASLENDFNK